jgi:integrase
MCYCDNEELSQPLLYGDDRAKLAHMATQALLKDSIAPDRQLDIVVDEVTALAPGRALIDPKVVEAAARGWSANTIRAFLSDLRLWDSWCRRSGIQPADATADTLAGYVRALSGLDRESGVAQATGTRAAATISRYFVNIGWAYRMAGRDDPTASQLVRFEHRAARRRIGTRQRQARGIRFKGDIEDLDAPASGLSLTALLKACRKDMLGARDGALLLTAYDTGCRRSELVAIDVDDIEGPDGDGAGTLFIPQSKTDREKGGAYAYLSAATMTAIARWRRMSGVERGALFRRVDTHFDGSVRRVGEVALAPYSITLIYKRLVRAAFERKLLGAISETELERWVSSVSSHSIRVGVAQDNFAAGEGLPAIMQAYRWRDAKTVMRYGAKLVAKSGASARLAKRFAVE